MITANLPVMVAGELVTIRPIHLLAGGVTVAQTE
jgi:hypothetical protein